MSSRDGRASPVSQDEGNSSRQNSTPISFAKHHLAHQLPPRSHSRAEVASPTQRAQASPQKSRTYDPKLVSREMHRLGNLAHLHPPAAGPPFAATASASSLTLPSTSPQNLPVPSSDNPWQSLHVHVLPLFNGDPLRIPIEDLNSLVKRHLNQVVSRSPSRAIGTLEADVCELLASGMMTLNAKLAGLEDQKLLPRLVELWGFFWDQILPYVEGVFIPLQTDPVLLSLSRTPKSVRPSSPTQSESTSSVSLPGSLHIDIRKLTLRAFRDAVILPIFPRLNACLTSPHRLALDYHQPRLQQMLLVLKSTAHHSLLLDPSHPNPGEQAVTELLRAVRQPVPQPEATQSLPPSRLPSFLSGATPRDRRGRIARKSLHLQQQQQWAREASAEDGDETPRNGKSALLLEVEREKELFAALRSPELDGVDQEAENTETVHPVGGGGWGLGDGRDEKTQHEDEEEGMENWDDAQDVVERMVGLKT